MENTVFCSAPSMADSDSQMAEFASKVSKNTWLELYDWSIQESEEFWQSFLRYSKIIYQGDDQKVFRSSAQGTFYGGSWFESVQLNFAQNLMEGMCKQPLVAHDEVGERPYSKKEVFERVRKIQSFLKEKGVVKGDVVAALLPNREDAIFAMLATTGLGAIWSSASPEFGVQGILDRFTQVEPKVLFLTENYQYNGKTFNLEEKNEELCKGLPTLEATLTVGSLAYEQLLDSDRSHKLEFKMCSFMHPLYILFSSGTTGTPKSIVHSAGGTLLQHFKELKLHSDIRFEENFGYFTTTGWMMWNWMVSALGVGARVHTYDGAPVRSDGWTLWDWAKEANLSAFGTSAKFIASGRVQKIQAYAPDSKLRIVFSTGSPLLPEDFDYFYSHEKQEKVQLASISGGTDIVSCFVLGNPLKDVLRGEVQGPGLGMAIAAYNELGKSVVEQQGELVCEKVFPAMPIYFQNDNNNDLFEKAYFKKYQNVWHHGDLITVKNSGGIVIHGRSDSTLNPGGVRIGTAEIYRQVETLEGVLDSVVVGRQIDGDEEVVLFVKLSPELTFSDELKSKITQRIREGASPRHVPKEIYSCPDIPYTLSGKKVELAVKKLLNGQEPENIEALKNPESLDFYRRL